MLLDLCMQTTAVEVLWLQPGWDGRRVLLPLLKERRFKQLFNQIWNDCWTDNNFPLRRFFLLYLRRSLKVALPLLLGGLFDYFLEAAGQLLSALHGWNSVKKGLESSNLHHKAQFPGDQEVFTCSVPSDLCKTGEAIAQQGRSSHLCSSIIILQLSAKIQMVN